MTVGLKTRKPLTSKGFIYFLLWMLIVDFRALFADTKLTKDIIQLVFIRYTPGDLP